MLRLFRVSQQFAGGPASGPALRIGKKVRVEITAILAVEIVETARVIEQLRDGDLARKRNSIEHAGRQERDGEIG